MASGNQLTATIFRARSEFVRPTETVRLKVTFKDMSGNPVDLDALPTVSIISPTGLVIVSPTTQGVQKNGLGEYEFDYATGIGQYVGVYNDVWQGVINGYPVESQFSFIVSDSQYDKNQTDGYVALGDDPGFNFSQVAIENINQLLKSLRARLKSSGKSKKTDAYGNVNYVNCDIFSVEVLVDFLVMSLSDFNMTPHFTAFTFEDTAFLTQFHDIIVRGATIYALASQALIEKGREFQISDNGISFTPPGVSDMLNTQYNTVLSNYYDQLKYIKASMKPSPIGQGSFTITNRSPMMQRLRHRRANQII